MPKADGKSFAKALDGKSSARKALLEDHPVGGPTGEGDVATGPWWGVRTPSWHLVVWNGVHFTTRTRIRGSNTTSHLNTWTSSTSSPAFRTVQSTFRLHPLRPRARHRARAPLRARPPAQPRRYRRRAFRRATRRPASAQRQSRLRHRSQVPPPTQPRRACRSRHASSGSAVPTGAAGLGLGHTDTDGGGAGRQGRRRGHRHRRRPWIRRCFSGSWRWPSRSS